MSWGPSVLAEVVSWRGSGVEVALGLTHPLRKPHWKRANRTREIKFSGQSATSRYHTQVSRPIWSAKHQHQRRQWPEWIGKRWCAYIRPRDVGRRPARCLRTKAAALYYLRAALRGGEFILCSPEGVCSTVTVRSARAKTWRSS